MNTCALYITLDIMLTILLSSALSTKFCEPMYNQEMEFYCRGIYNMDIAVKYEDGQFGIGQKYSVFVIGDRDEGHYFITFLENDFQQCKYLKLQKNGQFECTNSDGEIKILKESNTTLRCLDSYLEFANDMIKDCIIKQGVPVDDVFSEEIPCYLLPNSNADCVDYLVMTKKITKISNKPKITPAIFTALHHSQKSSILNILYLHINKYLILLWIYLKLMY